MVKVLQGNRFSGFFNKSAEGSPPGFKLPLKRPFIDIKQGSDKIAEVFQGDVINFYKNDHPRMLADIEQLKKDFMSDPEKTEVVLPECYKYVVVGKVPRPYDLTCRANSSLGAAGDRVGFEAQYLASRRMINFIRGLGYDAIPMPGENPMPALQAP